MHFHMHKVSWINTSSFIHPGETSKGIFITSLHTESFIKTGAREKFLPVQQGRRHRHMSIKSAAGVAKNMFSGTLPSMVIQMPTILTNISVNLQHEGQ